MVKLQIYDYLSASLSGESLVAVSRGRGPSARTNRANKVPAGSIRRAMGGSVSIFKAKSPAEPAEGSPEYDAAMKETWQIIKKQADVIGRAIFAKLFEEDPKTFQMFKSFRERMDWTESKGFKAHSRTVMNVIGSHVAKLQSEEELKTTIRTMGAAHSFFDITQRHFDIMRESLVEQLELHLKEKLTPNIKKGWLKAYDAVAVGILAGMKETSSRRVAGHH